MAANIHSLLQSWKKFDLLGFQKDLDARATELANKQEESDISRRKLVELCREFKKNTPEETRRVVAPVLKSFQSEIDSLCRRSKAAEAAFLTVYKKIIDLPDPVTAVEVYQSARQRAMRAQDQEFQNKRLKQTLNNYYQELEILTNQELTISQPQERKNAKVQTRQIQVERQLHEVQVNVAKKLEEAEQQVGELQSALELAKSEFLHLKSKYDDNPNSRSDTMEVFLNDLERANQRAVLAEKEATTLKSHLQAARQSLHFADTLYHDSDMDKNDYTPLELELAAKDKDISQLVEDVQKLQSTINKLKETSAYQIAQLEEVLADKNKAIQLLEDKLTKQHDYEEMKKELNVLKSSELPNNACPENDTSAKENNVILKPLDDLLIEKDKALQSENEIDNTAHIDSTDNVQNTLENSLPPPLQNVKVFTSLLGEEIVSSYAKIFKKDDNFDTHNKSKSLETSTSSATSTPSQALTCSKPNPIKNSFVYNVSNCNTLEKLQECLRKCMEKYASESLNTLNISRSVRELLSVHNIGQRLFAKYILGLSQGTVSELLSKPKPWDKLTEKGRDSYRKMHAWATDDNCIYMLKTLVPKKGKESELPTCRPEDPAAKDRITQILNEAQQAMLIPTKGEKDPVVYNGNMKHSSDWKSLNGTSHKQEEENREEGGIELDREGNRQQFFQNNIFYKEYPHINSSRHSHRQDSDDVSQEMITRIYQEELAKLMCQRMEDGFCVPRDQFERTQEEIRQALNIYYQEISRLSQLIPHSMTDLVNLGAPSNLVNGSMHYPTFPNFLHSVSLSSPHTRCDLHYDASTQPTNWPKKLNVGSPSDSEESHHHGSAFSLVKPKTELSSTTPKTPVSYHPTSNSSSTPPTTSASMAETSGLREDINSTVSPLQRMQSITNSLLTQSTLPISPNHPQRPAKAVLPPITQQQFDQYNNLNTEDIVKNVKEQLSQYSISQRLFGENVLGLSQGSVSDLLARPKPWYMLTQKGREPFIRMKIFLEDENATHKLVASQYKIPPEKLMRTGAYLGNKTSPGSSKISSQTSDPSVSQHLPKENSHHSLSTSFAPSAPVEPCQSPPKTVECPLAVASNNVTHCSISTHSINPRKTLQNSRPMPYMHPSVYEMAAMTTDLDTQSITSKVKETLLAHNIGQKIFGEAILGLSQGSVSELLSKPKPWHMLSIKGREPFIRMQLWLNDPQSAEKLQALKNDRREANKRKRNFVDVQEVTSSHKENQILNYGLPPPSPYSSTKKPRILFSEEQKEALRLAFSMDPYPSTATIEFLASELNLSVRTVTNWFHNYRMRLKQQASPGGQQSEPKLNDNISMLAVKEPGSGFDPAQFRFLLNGRLAEISREKGKIPNIYDRNCSPFNTQNENSGTLDLSMSSQHFPRSGGSSCSSFQSGPFEAACRSPDDHSASDINEDSNFSQDRMIYENSDRESVEEQQQQQSPSPCGHHLTQSSLKRTLASCSSSNRRKPAMPQWVNPELEYSPDSDVKSDDEEDTHTDNTDKGEIINGVCVRQTGDFSVRLSKPENTIKVEPEPAPAPANKNDLSQNCFKEEKQDSWLELGDKGSYTSSSGKRNQIVGQEVNCDNQESVDSSGHIEEWDEENGKGY
ncbi:homeobox protein cut-like 1 isoform X3 [Tachypleus tridentatus]|uniref:homeobox protein cut-like 1 isoform X3 n=1 Tax=Tachypleus tridentatus TaxID=6853 RepID=UPI003FCF151F